MLLKLLTNLQLLNANPLSYCIITVRSLLHKRTVIVFCLTVKLLVISNLILWYIIDALVANE
jgi:hypothetical protein